MNLLVRAALSSLEEVAVARGFKSARVDYRVNAKGELVLAIIVPPTHPGQWIDAWAGRNRSMR